MDIKSVGMCKFSCSDRIGSVVAILSLTDLHRAEEQISLGLTPYLIALSALAPPHALTISLLHIKSSSTCDTQQPTHTEHLPRITPSQGSPSLRCHTFSIIVRNSSITKETSLSCLQKVIFMARRSHCFSLTRIFRILRT